MVTVSFNIMFRIRLSLTVRGMIRVTKLVIPLCSYEYDVTQQHTPQTN